MAGSLRLPSDASTESARTRKILAEWRILTQLQLSGDGISYTIPHKEGPSDVLIRESRCEGARPRMRMQQHPLELSPIRYGSWPE